MFGQTLSAQELELCELLRPPEDRGKTPEQLQREAIRAHIAESQRLARARAGDKAAIAEIREERRALARVLAQAAAEVDAKLAFLHAQAATSETGD